MGKSVYSIVLDDAVVRAVDHYAGSCGISRSAAINRILAQHVQMDTGEQYIRQVFEALEQMAQGTALQMLSASEAQMQLRSPLRYKYNPTVRYQFELSPADPQTMGLFRVGLRTQNATLVEYLEQFYRLWYLLEQHYCANGEQIQAQIENGRFVRVLRRIQQPLTTQQQGQLLAGYAALFDRCLKAFFEDPSQQGVADVEQIYRSGAGAQIKQL